MTVFAKNITYGLETVIKDCQVYLNSKLPNYWSGDLEIYGQIFQTEKNGVIKPEAYKGTGIGNKEYTEVFINDKVAASIGFYVTDRNLTPFRSAIVDIIFTIRIDKIYPNSTTRDKEKVLLEAEKVLERFGGIGELTDLKEGVEQVFSDFTTDPIKYRDMHPWFVFSFTTELLYNDDRC